MANEISVGYDIDGTTLTLGANNTIAVNPSTITQASSNIDITYSTNTTLVGDIYCNNLTINPGVVLTTNGHNIYCSGTFTNNGTINTGSGTAGGAGGSGTATGSNGTSITTSYGGSGGGGGGVVSGYGSAGGGAGGSTVAAGGGGGGNNNPGGNGSTPAAPTLSNSTIQTWYNNGMQDYLEGAGGGGGGAVAGSGGWASGGSGGSGGAGIYIQANQIIAGTINANGQNGGGGASGHPGWAGGGGGGGGGAIVLAYGSGGYTAGTYNVSGGSGGGGTASGGSGGNGQVLTYNYSTPPISISWSGYSAISGTKNRVSTYQYSTFTTTSTTPVYMPNQFITPKSTGLVSVRVVVNVSNNTAGDGVWVGLYNGSTELDSGTFTSTAANQTGQIYLYAEVLYSAPFSQQAFSLEYNAVTGGTATAEILEFTIEEVY